MRPQDSNPANRRTLCASLDVEALDRAARFPRQRLDRCPHCGTEREDVRRDEMLGCPLCYVVFESEVLEIVT